MYNLLLIVHVLIVVSLVSLILVQRGRSGGLVEALGGVESIFGTKTSVFFVKMTVILAILFFLSSISLAYVSKERGKSLMENYELQPAQEKPVLFQQEPSPEIPTEESTTEPDTPKHPEQGQLPLKEKTSSTDEKK